MTYTVKRYSADVYGIYDNDRLVANALQLTNGMWRAYDLKDKPIGAVHKTPKDVVKAMVSSANAGVA